MATKAEPLAPSASASISTERESTFEIFRRWGYLQASLDPLGQYLPPEPFPTPAPECESVAEARSYYCGTIAAEFMHIADPERRQWLQEQMEQIPPKPDQKHILTQ